ncbi:Host-nuclease inhibitor protein gam [Shigella sonnei]|nr:Host-nuclease inhibitor protein gam [Escherichia coli]OYL60101.1 Host-nuclease inhibitor protein gam [Shigella sonnei]
MDINTETEIKQKHSLPPFPVFLISPAFRGRYFHSYFRSSAMNAYYIQDRLEAQSWARHYQQIAREEKEAELADDMEKCLHQHLFESLCIDHLQRHGASKKAITRAFDDDVEFQERMAEHIRYMVETIAHHQVDIDSEV